MTTNSEPCSAVMFRILASLRERAAAKTRIELFGKHPISDSKGQVIAKHAETLLPISWPSIY